jgi:hypothetical protein
MTTRTRRIGSALLAATGVLHLALAPEYLSEQTYIGVGFIAGGLAALAIAAWLWIEEEDVGWALGALLAAGMALGFVLSRTVGLPSFHEGEWELSGVVSLVIEGAFVGLAAASLRDLIPGRRWELMAE